MKNKFWSKHGIVLILIALFAVGAHGKKDRKVEREIKGLTKKIERMEKRVGRLSELNKAELNQVYQGFDTLKRRMEKAKPKVKSDARFKKLFDRLSAIQGKAKSADSVGEVKTLVATYNFNIDKWKKGRNGSSTPLGFANEIRRKIKSGMSGSQEVEVKDGKFTLSKLATLVEAFQANNISSCIEKQHAFLKRKGEAKKLFSKRGEPQFTNHYCKPKSSYILWVYKYSKDGVRYQDVYHMDPLTGKVKSKQLMGKI